MNQLRIIGASITAFIVGVVLTATTVQSLAGDSQPRPDSADGVAAKKDPARDGSRVRADAAKKGGKGKRKKRPKSGERCPPEAVKLGTTCMMTNPYPLDNSQVGLSNYFFASQKCAGLGGYLPTAAQLIGAAPYVKLAGRLDDNEVTSSKDIDATDGLRDLREMSATLTTTASGGRAAGAIGVSDQATGDPKTGEPDPTPVPANPSPETLAYVTVFDNHELGGFGGAEPVGQPGLFRCAFNVSQAPPRLS